jgi:hypothetical protein
VLLDELDEVPHDQRESVRDAIYQFAGDQTPDMPTERARMVLICRAELPHHEGGVNSGIRRARCLDNQLRENY